MSLQSIVIAPDPILRKVLKQVYCFDRRLKSLAHDMIDTMYDAEGIGLAANQIGLDAQILVMDCSYRDQDDHKPLIMINPKLTWVSEDISSLEEGCLSLPGQRHEIIRPIEVDVFFQDLQGEERSLHLDGLAAKCVQHEIDHLQGKLILDYLSPLKRKIALRKAEKYKLRSYDE